jgi:hypothetical protein
MSDKMRTFIRSLPNAADLDPVKRTAAEREIERRLGALSADDRKSFERELRELNTETHRAMTFEQRWGAARHHAALKEQIEGNGENR